MELSTPVFAKIFFVASLSARTFYGVGISNWTSVHSMDSDTETISMFGSSLVAICFSGSSLMATGLLAGSI